MNNENKHSKSDCSLIGQKLPPGQYGNIFNLVGIAARTLEKHGQPTDASEMTGCVFYSKSYEEALNIIGEYVNIISVD